MRVDMFRAKSSTAKKPETNQQLQLESENNTNNFEDSETVVIQLPKTINYYEDCLNSFKTSVESLSSSPLTKRKHVLGEVNEVSHLTPANRKKGFVQQLVEYSQTLAGFSELNIEDKTTLLGESFSEVLLLRSAFNFNFERDSLVVLLDCEMNISVYTKLDVFYQKVNFFICLHRSLAYLVRELIQGDPLVRELVSRSSYKLFFSLQNLIEDSSPAYAATPTTPFLSRADRLPQRKVQSPLKTISF